ncbi:hypothetical protein K504DRAFT_461787 [Pleomassaria siparia CBS 279.74]|uniref:Uncharacterized protein n=1 Tax=Pleomassaria siparia CBS 279.74 TaxID=1314801 RepID=A0A6G1KKB2_9PLEO|nr:hypothetical protein K504DRAFT_461787 [Pleomassaria siparia CBS 279.74]
MAMSSCLDADRYFANAPTTNPSYALGYVRNAINVVSQCCNTKAARYNSVTPDGTNVNMGCFTYCEITQQNVTLEEVDICVNKTLAGANLSAEWARKLSTGGTVTQESNAVHVRSVGTMGYFVLGLAFAGVFGMM